MGSSTLACHDGLQRNKKRSLLGPTEPERRNWSSWPSMTPEGREDTVLGSCLVAHLGGAMATSDPVGEHCPRVPVCGYQSPSAWLQQGPMPGTPARLELGGCPGSMAQTEAGSGRRARGSSCWAQISCGQGSEPGRNKNPGGPWAHLSRPWALTPLPHGSIKPRPLSGSPATCLPLSIPSAWGCLTSRARWGGT